MVDCLGSMWPYVVHKILLLLNPLCVCLKKEKAACFFYVFGEALRLVEIRIVLSLNSVCCKWSPPSVHPVTLQYDVFTNSFHHPNGRESFQDSGTDKEDLEGDDDGDEDHDDDDDDSHLVEYAEQEGEGEEEMSFVGVTSWSNGVDVVAPASESFSSTKERLSEKSQLQESSATAAPPPSSLDERLKGMHPFLQTLVRRVYSRVEEITKESEEEYSKHRDLEPESTVSFLRNVMQASSTTEECRKVIEQVTHIDPFLCGALLWRLGESDVFKGGPVINSFLVIFSFSFSSCLWNPFKQAPRMSHQPWLMVFAACSCPNLTWMFQT